MTDDNPQELSDALKRETDELARDGREVKASVEETRADWERKRRDERVPGAPPPTGEESDDSDQADDA
jgi:hypothetical protein